MGVFAAPFNVPEKRVYASDSLSRLLFISFDRFCQAVKSRIFSSVLTEAFYPSSIGITIPFYSLAAKAAFPQRGRFLTTLWTFSLVSKRVIWVNRFATIQAFYVFHAAR